MTESQGVFRAVVTESRTGRLLITTIDRSLCLNGKSVVSVACVLHRLGISWILPPGSETGSHSRGLGRYTVTMRTLSPVTSVCGDALLLRPTDRGSNNSANTYHRDRTNDVIGLHGTERASDGSCVFSRICTRYVHSIRRSYAALDKSERILRNDTLADHLETSPQIGARHSFFTTSNIPRSSMT